LGVTREEWNETPIRVRMAIHRGEPEERAGDYFGPVVNETARLMATAHPGQILTTVTPAQSARARLPEGVGSADLGEQRIKDIDQSMWISQVTHPDLPFAFPPLRGLVEIPNNLPNQLTSFVGRDRELEEIYDLMQDSRLVTLTGAGGSGKTRLALEFASEVLDEFPDGVWLADLATVEDPAQVPRSVAASLGLSETAERPIVDQLVDRLRQQVALLVLDNCEHVLTSAASLVIDVLQRTAAVRVVATSREPLDVAGEQPYVVPTLEAPDVADIDPEVLVDYPAVRLFSDRAEIFQPGFRITRENATAVAKICQRLDGLPLALELAAARLNILSPADLLDRLDDRFALLTSSSPQRLARHQTLEATLDWSYQLLDIGERTILDRLSVFAGGFNLDAAEQVCSVGRISRDQVLDIVSGLVHKSLLVADLGVADRRFRFLETVRAYASARLAASGEHAELGRTHAAYFRQLAIDSYNQVWGPDEVEWLDRLDEEWPNLRRSLQWHLDERQTQEGLMMAGSLYRFFWRRYHNSEGAEWLRRFVEADPTPSPGRARALLGIGTLSISREDYTSWDEAIQLYRQFGPRDDLAAALTNGGVAATWRGEWEKARKRLTEALQLNRDLGDPVGISVTLGAEATFAVAVDNDLVRALELLEESLPWARQSGSPERLAGALRDVGVLRRHTGDLDGAVNAIRQAQQLTAKLGGKQGVPGWIEAELASIALDRDDIHAAKAYLLNYNDVVQPVKQDRDLWDAVEKPLLQWARIALALEQHEVAVTLLAAVDSFRRDPRSTVSRFPPYTAELEHVLLLAKERLDPGSFDPAWDRGQQMTSSQALDYAADTLAPRATDHYRR
jgi:predicted ATPase